MSARQTIENAWNITFDVDKCFPTPLNEWIKFKATLLGVPTSYIAWPVLVAFAHATQHTYVNIGRKGILHREPTAIYGLVIGRSGE